MLARSALRRVTAPVRNMSSLVERKNTLNEHRKKYYSHPAVGMFLSSFAPALCGKEINFFSYADLTIEYLLAIGVDNPTYLKGPNDKYVIPVLMTLVGSGVCAIGYTLSILAFK
jgi:hypothetical protein